MKISFEKILITTFLTGALVLGGYFIVKAANDTTFTGNSQVPCFEYYTGFFNCASATNPQLSPFNAAAGQITTALNTVAVLTYEKYSAGNQWYPLQMIESATASVSAGGGNSPPGMGLWLGNGHLLTFQSANGSDTNGTGLLPLGNVLATGMFGFDTVSGKMQVIGTNGSGNGITTSLAGTKTPSDTLANPTDGTDVISYNVVWDPVTAKWMRYTQAYGVSTSCAAVAVTGACTTLDHHFQPKATHTWTIIVTGAPASQNTNLEGSLDNANWFTLDSSTTTTSEMRHVVDKLVPYIRANVTSLVGGAGPTVAVAILDGGQN